MSNKLIEEAVEEVEKIAVDYGVEDDGSGHRGEKYYTVYETDLVNTLHTLLTTQLTELEEKQPKLPATESREYVQGFVDCNEMWLDTLIAEKKKVLGNK